MHKITLKLFCNKPSRFNTKARNAATANGVYFQRDGQKFIYTANIGKGRFARNAANVITTMCEKAGIRYSMIIEADGTKPVFVDSEQTTQIANNKI